MTLCLAWKQGQDIYFASDSKLTNSSNEVVTYYACKIFKIDVEIYKDFPEIFSGVPKKAIYKTTYGMCFSGSYLNGSILADTIDNFLSNILAGPNADYSMDNLSKIAFAIYKQVSNQLMEIHKQNGLSQVFFGGYCLIEKDFKLYKFYPQKIVSSQSLGFLKDEVKIENQTLLIGDEQAKLKALELLKKINSNYTHYHLLREIINDNSVSTVGGNIQIGCFQGGIFKIHGIVEPNSYKDDNGYLQIEDKYKLCGLELDMGNANSELFSGKIATYEAFLSPFQKEKQELIHQQGQKDRTD